MAGLSHASAWPVTKVEVNRGDLGAWTAYRQEDGWQNISLPDAWLISNRSGTWTYRFTLDICPPGGGPKCVSADKAEALWIPKVGRELAVWINGGRVLYVGPVGRVERDITRRPVLVTIPASLMHPGLNEFRLVVTGPAHQALGLSRVWLGPEGELIERHAWRDYLAMGARTVIALGSAIFAVVGLLVALHFGGKETWLFVLISVLWCARELMLLLGTSVFPLDVALALTTLLQGVALLVSCWLLLDLMALSGRRWSRVLLWQMACIPLVALGWWAGGDASWVWMWGWHRLTNLTGLSMTTIALYATWRQPSWPRLAVTLGMLGAAALILIDDWQLELSGLHMGFEHLPLVSLIAAPFLLSVGASVYMRVVRALRLEAQHKQVLEDEVLRQRQQLLRLHERESARLRAEAVTDERARIVREMHDGLGAQLVGLLSTVESGEYTQAELSSDVHEAMGHLRLTIDTLDPLENDLASLLGQLRFRLESRMRKAGLKLAWHVQPLPEVDYLGAAELGHLQRLLFEAFTNVIKHAGATQVEVFASLDSVHQCIDIRIRDNGSGFNVDEAPQGRGVNNMRYRAEQIGADLRITAAQGVGTEVIVKLPLVRRDA